MFDFRPVSTASDRVYGIKVKSEKDANDDQVMQNQTFSHKQGHDMQVKIESYVDDDTISLPLQGDDEHDIEVKFETDSNDRIIQNQMQKIIKKGKTKFEKQWI